MLLKRREVTVLPWLKGLGISHPAERQSEILRDAQDDSAVGRLAGENLRWPDDSMAR